MLEYLIHLLLLLYVFFLPGLLITRFHYKKEDILTTIALSFGLSIVIVPIASFAASLVLHTTVQKHLVYLVSTVISLIYFLLKLKNPETCPKCKG